jgi:hypothetical protein
MSLDEAAALHDLTAPFFYGVFTILAARVGGPFIALAHKPGYAWIVPGTAFYLVVAIAYIPFLAALPRRTAWWFVGSAIVYVGGAVGFEAIGGWYSGTWGSQHPGFVAIMTCEETLEMIGMTLFLYTLLAYLEANVGSIVISFAPHGGSLAAGDGRRAVAKASARHE